MPRPDDDEPLVGERAVMTINMGAQCWKGTPSGKGHPAAQGATLAQHGMPRLSYRAKRQQHPQFGIFQVKRLPSGGTGES